MSTPSSVVTAKTMTGGRALAEMMKLAHVDVMFGMGGFQLLPYYDAIAELGLRHILINDERAGAFASDAFARVTNRPAVCDGTLGPGATNLVTGLVESLNAGIPMIAITGDVHRAHATKNMTQECRQVEILRPAVKELIRVDAASRIPELVRRAFAVSTSGRPGPVLLDVPEDVAHAEHDFDREELFIDPRTCVAPSIRTRPAVEDTESAARLLSSAKRPVLLVGGGIHLSQASEALVRLAEGLGMPVAHTLSGKGAIACTHKLSIGLFGRYSQIANDLINSADCLLVVGCKLGEIATKRYTLLNPRVPIIHLDIVAEEIGRTASPEIAMWGDAREGLRDLLAALEDDASRLRKERADYCAEIAPRKARWREKAKARLDSTERPINMARLVNDLNKLMPEDGILVADGGFAAHWTGLIYETKKNGRHYIADRGLASIGYGVPASIGASLANPETPVISITGDGGLNMALGDLETALRSGATPTIIVINNAASGYVKALQHAMYGQRYQSSDLSEMNYAEIAKTMGCNGIRVTDPAEIVSAVQAGIEERDVPTIIDVIVTRDPAEMLPAVDSRAVKIKKGDRIA